jgi:hypothetical protein
MIKNEIRATTSCIILSRCNTLSLNFDRSFKYKSIAILFHLASTEVSSTRVEGHSFPGLAPKKKILLHLTSTEDSSTKVDELLFSLSLDQSFKYKS